MKKNILKGMAILTTMAICLAGCGNSSSGSGDNQGAVQDTGNAADAAGENEGAAAQDTDGAADAQSGAARGKVVFAYWGRKARTVPSRQRWMISGPTTRKIFVPLSVPICASVAIMEFMGTWNSFTDPLIYINSDKWKTLTLGLAGFQGTYSTETNLLMAASIIVILPCIILFFCAQKVFVEGVTFSGSKE